MTELLCELLFGAGLILGVFGTAGIALWTGSLAVSAIGMAIDELLRRRPG